MPVVGIPVKILLDLIGKEIKSEKLVKYCQEIGAGVEDLTTIKRLKCRKCGNIMEFLSASVFPNSCEVCQISLKERSENYELLSDTEMIRLDLLADRPDNFDAGGLSRTLKGYLGIETGLINYNAGSSTFKVHVDKALSEAGSFRPFIACAVIKNITFNDDSLKNLMKLQENLHWALGRNRKNASIGVYDLKNLSETIHYKTVGKRELKFTPLGLTEEMYPEEILEKHPKGAAFSHLLSEMERYPILIDEKWKVLSMPPIINSEGTKVSLASKELFIDVTGLVKPSVEKALNIIVTTLKEWNPDCEIQTVRIIGEKEETTPVLIPRNFTLSFENTSKLIGVELTPEEITALLEKMRFQVEAKDKKSCTVKIPCYRNDIMHENDLIEDVAIAYGFHNIKPRLIESFTPGTPLYKEEIKDKLRLVLIGLGFLEVMNIMLTSEKRSYEKLKLQVPHNCCLIENPISTEQTLVRTHLLPGILETLENNTANELPQKIFEIGEIIYLDEKGENGTREAVKLAAGMVGVRMGFADIKACLVALLKELGLEAVLEKGSYPFYLNGRAGDVYIKQKNTEFRLGHLGEIHPEILENFNLSNPVVTFEIEVPLNPDVAFNFAAEFSDAPVEIV